MRDSSMTTPTSPQRRFTDSFARITTPRKHAPTSPLHSQRAAKDTQDLSFQQLIYSVLKIHEELQTRNVGLQAENQGLHLQLERIKQNISVLGVTPRPEGLPNPLLPIVNSGNMTSVEEQSHTSSVFSASPRAASEVLQTRVDGNVGKENQKISGVWEAAGSYSGSPVETEVLVHSPSARSLSKKTTLTRSDTSRSLMPTHRNKFKQLDKDGHGEIPADQLEEMLDLDLKQHTSKKSRQSADGQGMGQATCLDVIKAVSAFNGEEQTTLSYSTFVTLMTQEDLNDCFDAEVCERIIQIRHMFARDDMSKVVAQYANLHAHDLTQGHDGESKLRYLDFTSIVAIFLNAVMLAVSSDAHEEWAGWQVLEYCFTSFFLIEFLIKIKILGVQDFYFGSDAVWNSFDFVVLMIALIDAMLSIFATNTSNIQLFTMARLVRLARVTRFVRLLRFKAFKELLLMIRGVFAGMRTLFWAMVLLSMLIFMLGMLMRQTMGRWCQLRDINTNQRMCVEEHLVEHGENLFATLPRACLTVFRCFTDGCAAPDGTPLLVHIFEDGAYGQAIVVIYVICFLFVTFGLFNLIMAIFVENTMEAAKNDERKRKKFRQQQAVTVAQKLQVLVLEVCKVQNPDGNRSTVVSDEDKQPKSMLGRARNVLHTLMGTKLTAAEEAPQELSPIGLDVEIDRETFCKMFADPTVEKLLEDLELTVTDPSDLFDILDADGSGSIDVSELIKGILKLRGTAEKSDVVACLLAVRSIQKSLTYLEKKVSRNHSEVCMRQDRVDLQVRVLDECLQEVVPGYREQVVAVQIKLQKEASLPRQSSKGSASSFSQ